MINYQWWWLKTMSMLPVCENLHPGGHSNNSVVHTRNQRFSKHTLNEICSLQEEHPLNKNFVQFLQPILPQTRFSRNILLAGIGLKNDPLMLSNKIKRNLTYISLKNTIKKNPPLFPISLVVHTCVQH